MSIDSLPNPEGPRKIDFDGAEVVPGIIPGSLFLVVKGEAPCLNMKVTLEPMIYLQKPEYWGIEVIGNLPGGVCLTAMKPYIEAIPLDGILGHKGIEVIGATKSEKIDIP